jgi:hypothetical protein
MNDRVRSLALKVGATATTLLTVLGAAAYVSGHVRSQSAPLHPPVVSGGATPAVGTTSRPPLTSTYVS